MLQNVVSWKNVTSHFWRRETNDLVWISFSESCLYVSNCLKAEQFISNYFDFRKRIWFCIISTGHFHFKCDALHSILYYHETSLQRKHRCSTCCLSCDLNFYMVRFIIFLFEQINFMDQNSSRITSSKPRLPTFEFLW